ncbi:transposable element Tcb1 transposase [Trichonephila clavipes]|nr:transposable element Tcb1 transposase [Trichonephila clavipes]
MSLRRFRKQDEQLSQFEKGRIIGMKEAGWSARRVAHQLGCFDCATFGIAVPITCAAIDAYPSTPPFGLVPLRGNWTAAEWSKVILSDESRFNLSSDDSRVRVWRLRYERFNPTFALERRTTSTAGVMVWGVIPYNTRSPQVLIRGTMTAQRYVHDILQPHVLPLMQRLPGAIFQNTMLGLPRQGCQKTFYLDTTGIANGNGFDRCVTVVSTVALISATDEVRCVTAVRRIRLSSVSVVPRGHLEPYFLEAVSSLDHCFQQSCTVDTFQPSFSAMLGKENPPSRILDEFL